MERQITIPPIVGLAPLCVASLVLALSGCFATAPTQPVPQSPPIAKTLPSRGDVAAVDPAESARVNVELASNYYSWRQFDSALETVTRALNAAPRDARAHVMAGFIQLELHDTSKAQWHFDRALENQPRDPEVLHNYGTFLCRTNRQAQAIAYFDGALAVATYRRPAVSHAAAGVCLTDIDRKEDALARFDAALAVDARHAQALLGKAEILAGRGEYRQARELLRMHYQVAQASPESLWLDVRVSTALGARGDAAMAATDLRTLFPDSRQAGLLRTMR